MKQNKKKIQENTFRALVRAEIAKVLREEEEMATDQDVETEPEKEEEPEQDNSEVLEKLTYSYTKALKNNIQDLGANDLADAMDSIMSHFGYGKDTKMDVLRTLKNKIQA